MLWAAKSASPNVSRPSWGGALRDASSVFLPYACPDRARATALSRLPGAPKATYDPVIGRTLKSPVRNGVSGAWRGGGHRVGYALFQAPTIVPSVRGMSLVNLLPDKARRRVRLDKGGAKR
ncbi:MAG: hypothetical protein AMXMBFR7_19100 [Planctomycetota bacterium]